MTARSAKHRRTPCSSVSAPANIDGEFRGADDRAIGNQPPARKFSDYIVEIDRANLPGGVEIVERL